MLTNLSQKISHFNKTLAGFKYLKLLYVVAFLVGLTASVYVQNQTTNSRSKASGFPVYRYRCQVDLYYSYGCKPENFNKSQTELIDDISPPKIGCDTTYFPSTTSKDIKSCELVECISSNCPGGTPTLTPKPPTQTLVPPTFTPIPPTSVSGRCTGSTPANAFMHDPEESAGLISNVAKTYSAQDTPTKCQFRCNQNYNWNISNRECVSSSGSGSTLTPVPPTNTTIPGRCTGKIPANATAWGADEDDDLQVDKKWEHAYSDAANVKCQFVCTSGVWTGTACGGTGGGGTTATPSPTTIPTRSVTNTPRPPTATPTPIFGTKGCGISCGSSSECQSGFTCRDVNSGGNVCWNESICGGPALKSRIEGIVRGCNNQPLPNVPVWAWGNIDYTDQSGKFQLNKGVNRNSDGDIMLNETSILAGNDATKNTATGLGYFDNATGRQFDALQLRSGNSCGLVNCLFRSYIGDSVGISNNHKLMVGGPTRTAYRIQGMTNSLFEYNFVFTDYHAGKFNFKQINCPTSVSPTLTPPTLLSCNASCTYDAACANTNPNWYCATQWNYSSWSLRNSEFIASNNGLTASGKITGMNNHISANLSSLEQHVVKNNEVYYRTKPVGQSGWTSTQVFQNVNSYVTDVGCSTLGYSGTTCTNFKNQYKIIDFNTFIYISNSKKITQQHLLRSNGTYTYIFSRDNENGWSNWTDVSANLSGVGSISGANNVITSFSTYVTNDNYWLQTLVRGGRVYQRQLGLYDWISATSTFNSCTGSQTYVENGVTKTGNGTCGNNPNGSNPIIAYKPIKMNDGKVSVYLVRKDSNVYSLTSYPNGEKCRLKSSPWNTNCGATPTPVP